MTQQQQNLVIDNHNLIYFLLHRLGYDVEEWYDLCAIGLCKAAVMYKPEFGFSFSTFAVKCMKNEICNEQHKHRSRLPVRQAVSLNEYIAPDIDIEIQDTIADSNDLFGRVELQLSIKDTVLTPREREAMDLYIAGYKQREIAECFSVSQECISQRIRNAKAKIQKCLEMSDCYVCR